MTKRRIIADISKVEILGIRDHEGRVWDLTPIEARNTQQSVAYQRYSQSFLAVQTAIAKNDPRVEKFADVLGYSSVELLCALLSNPDDPDERPDEEYAAEMVRRGIMNQFNEYQIEQTREDEDDADMGEKAAREFDLDAFEESIDRPMGAATGSTSDGSPDASASTDQAPSTSGSDSPNGE